MKGSFSSSFPWEVPLPRRLQDNLMTQASAPRRIPSPAPGCSLGDPVLTENSREKKVVHSRLRPLIHSAFSEPLPRTVVARRGRACSPVRTPRAACRLWTGPYLSGKVLIKELATCPFLGGAGLRYWGHTPQPSAPKGTSLFSFIYVILMPLPSSKRSLRSYNK